MKSLIAASVLIAAAGGASAQDVRQDPTYRTLDLRSGFTNDPVAIAVQSGGGVDAAALNHEQHVGTCSGNVGSPPDVRLNYTAGQLPLIISVDSQSDTTLVVNGPDGQWYCDDDSGHGPLNPSITFAHPGSGQYDIWVGTYNGNGHGRELHPAQLNISELDSK